jgi:hypothetical protein
MTADSTQRSRRFRERERNGQVRLTAWKDEIAVDTLLHHHGLAPAQGFDDPDKRNAAWDEFVDRLIRVDAEQHREASDF